MTIELLPTDPVYPNEYHVRPNHCNCHPETCCCNDWAVYSPSGKKESTHFHKEDAEIAAHSCNIVHGLCSTIPWTHCKIAFDIKDSDDIWSKIDTPAVEQQLPKGWSLSETEENGTNAVAIFDVDGVLSTIEDGETVKKLLQTIKSGI